MRLLSASLSTVEARRAEGVGPAFGLFMAASKSEESVVIPCNILSWDARVKIATRVWGGIVFTYLIICLCTYTWSEVGVLRASSRMTFTESAVCTNGKFV